MMAVAMFYYRPPKSSIWGHRLRKMPAARASELFEKFLATATGSHQFTTGSLTCFGVPGGMTARFEKLLGLQSLNCFFHLNQEQTRTCLQEIIKHEAANPAGPRPYSLLESINVSCWRINGEDVATDSTFSMHYGSLPCLSTFLHFDSIDQFHFVRQALADLGICKLNEKHLRPSRSKNLKT